MPMERQTHFNFWYFVIAMMVIILLQQWLFGSGQVQTVPYSEFQSMVRDGKVSEVSVADEYIRGTLHKPLPDGRKQIFTLRVDPDLAADLEKHGVTVTGVAKNTFIGVLLSWVVPVLIFVVAWMYLFRRIAERQGMGGFLNVGKSKAKIYMETDTKVSFDDVAGVDEAKEELKEVVRFLREPESYRRLGAHIPKGVLLVPRLRRRKRGEEGRNRPHQNADIRGDFPAGGTGFPLSRLRPDRGSGPPF